MSTSCLADRFGTLIDLTPAERRALARLEERSRSVRRGTVLVREKDPRSDLFILTRGTAMSYTLLGDGSRQILRFLFPGDIINLSSMVYSRAVETIAGVSECTVAPFERQALTGIIAEHPRISALIMAINQIDRVALTGRLVALGRTSAKARVAAILLEIRDSQRGIGRPAEAAFFLGLTQEEIADAAGLTAVHVNRMLRRLEEEKLIARDAGRMTLIDEPALSRIASYTSRFDGIDLGWLPAG